MQPLTDFSVPRSPHPQPFKENSFLLSIQMAVCQSQFVGNFHAAWRSGDAAQSRFAQRNIHLVPDVFHGHNDLVRRHSRADSGQRHIGAAHGDHCTGSIALDARHFHQPGNRVAHQPQQALDRQRGRVADRLRIAAAQIAQRRRGHRARRTDFILAAARRAGNGSLGSHRLPNRARDTLF